MTRYGHSPAPTPVPAPTPAADGPLWPTVIGVLSMVLAARVLLGSNAVGGYAASQMIGALHGISLPPLGPLDYLRLCLGLLGGAAGVLLMVAGLLLWRRRRGGALHVAYAVAALVGLGGMLFVQVWSYRRSTSEFQLFLLYQHVGTTLAAVPYPIFALVWFLRKKVRSQMRAWRRTPPAERPRPRPGSAWPAVVGVLSMALGGLGAFACLWSMGAPLWRRLVAPDLRMTWAGGQSLWICSMGGFAALNLLLLVAGWMLVHGRLRRAAICHLICAALTIVAAIGLPLLWLASVRNWPGTAAGLFGFLPAMASWMFQTLAYPVFLLVWFLRRKIRAQVKSPPRAGGLAPRCETPLDR